MVMTLSAVCYGELRQAVIIKAVPYLSKTVVFITIDPGTVLGHLLPSFRGSQVPSPERPGHALPGTEFIDDAAIFAVEEETVVILPFGEAGSQFPHNDGVTGPKILLTHAQMASDSGDLLIIHPDVSGVSGTAITTALAFEVQAIIIPGFHD